MKNFQTFQVVPRIPKPLQFLETLSHNMWWCWNLDAIELFRRIDPRLWEEIEAWARQDLRSVNGQIEFLLRRAINEHKKSRGPGPGSNTPDE
mgnify:CR=1 FL=1